MKLATLDRDGERRLGIVMGARVVDAHLAAWTLGCETPPVSVRQALEKGPERMRDLERKARRVLEGGGGEDWSVPLASARLLPPICDPPKVICIGQNYIDHCREQNLEPPKSPILFTKFATTLSGPRADIPIPPAHVTRVVDYEVELAFVVSRRCKRVSRDEAMECVGGYMVMNDVTARDLQRSEGQWTRAKSLDGFGPCGPWVTTADEVPNPGKLGIRLKLNGQTMQDSSTSNLIFDVPYLIEFISSGLTLEPGDIVSTGTPPGVGVFRKPPVLLKPGDVVEAEIEGLGGLVNRCVQG